MEEAPKGAGAVRSGSLPWMVLEKGREVKEGWGWVVDAIRVLYLFPIEEKLAIFRKPEGSK